MLPSLLLGLIAVAAPPPAWSVAAPAWQVEAASPEQAEQFKQHLDDALRDQGFRILSPGEAEAPLKPEQVPQQSSCGDEVACLAKLGRAMDVQGVLATKLKRFSDGSMEAQLSLISSSDGKVLVRSEASGGNDAEMIRSLDEAALALGAGASMERLPDAPATPTPREQSVSSAAVTTGPPPALAPYQTSIPSMSLIALDEPANAWIPATTGGFFALLGAQQVADAQLRRREEAATPQLGPVPDQTDYLTGVASPDPNRQQLAGLAGIGFGLAAIAGAYNVFQLGADAPYRIEPFAGPTGGGIGLTTRW
ncbi:MAG: hypothetical protein H6Q89_1143 [Myxococcaceae bacterium]|nr:hypothetical protein [Myxococcaceae bacterium]